MIPRLPPPATRYPLPAIDCVSYGARGYPIAAGRVKRRQTLAPRGRILPSCLLPLRPAVAFMFTGPLRSRSSGSIAKCRCCSLNRDQGYVDSAFDMPAHRLLARTIRPSPRPTRGTAPAPPFVPRTRPDHLQRADRLLPLSRHNRVHRRSGACLIVQVARPGERLVALVASGSHRFARPTPNVRTRTAGLPATAARRNLPGPAWR